MDTILLAVLSCAVVIQITVCVTLPGPSDRIKLCGNLTCAPNAKCINVSGGIHCLCQYGFWGKTCFNDVDECSIGNPCLNRGVCHNNIGSYWCECLHGWNGYHCDENITVIRDCMPGWTGEWCETCTDDHIACGPRKYCKRKHGKNEYFCSCNSGWHGRNCTDDTDECRVNNPCKNSGSCINTVGSYMCACPAGWTGPTCSDKDICLIESPCDNAATCSTANHTYHCLCLDGWQGINCTEDIDECRINKCAHAQSCSNRIGSYSCTCSRGWQGDDCNDVANGGNSNAGIIAGVTIGSILAILIAVLALFYKYKWKRYPGSSVAVIKENND